MKVTPYAPLPPTALAAEARPAKAQMPAEKAGRHGPAVEVSLSDAAKQAGKAAQSPAHLARAAIAADPSLAGKPFGHVVRDIAQGRTPAAPETPVVETPVTEAPVTETPVVETPVTETPVVETPVVETPVTETPVVDTPVAEVPVTETPVVDTPVAEVPVTETPVVDLPPTDVAVEETPIILQPAPTTAETLLDQLLAEQVEQPLV